MDYQQLHKLQRRYDALIFEAHKIRHEIETLERESKEQKQKRLLEFMSKKGIDLDQLEKIVLTHED